MKKLLYLLILIPLCFALSSDAKMNFYQAASVGGGAAPAGCSEGSDQVIIGATTGTENDSFPHNYILFSKFTALHTCTIDSMSLGFATANQTHFRVGIYADSSGHATGSPLAYTSDLATTGNGEQTVEGALNTTVDITQGTVYHLASVISLDCAPYNTHSPGNADYQAWTYSASGALPDVGSLSTWEHYFGVAGLSQ
jgi:hypothetical protein